jgi:WD40 repeat protein/nucleoside phosphorylase
MAQYQFDALILTALLDELEPVLEFGEGGKSQWKKDSDSTGLPYHFRELPSALDGLPLRIAAASFNEMGEGVTAARASALIQELDPACLAMCGICAGNKKDVALGDVIVADRTYKYDHGKLVAWRDKQGKRTTQLYQDLKTYNLEDTWRVNAAYFAKELGWTAELVKLRPPSRQSQQDWLLWTLFEYEQKNQPLPYDFGGQDRKTLCPEFPSLWDRLQQPDPGLLDATEGFPRLTDKGRAKARALRFKYPDGLRPDRDFQIHVGPIATGSIVQKDPELFDRLERHIRKTLGAEMEAVAIALAAEQLKRRSIIVKAASDHGDGEKNDSFRKFAARASAEVLIRFLLEQLEPSTQQTGGEQEQHTFSPRPSLLDGPATQDDLLSRVQKIAELRALEAKETAEIRRFPTAAPIGAFLRVTGIRDIHRGVFPLAAVEQVTAEVLDAFLVNIDAPYRRRDAGVRSTLVYGGAPAPTELVAKAAAKGILLQSFTEYQGLIDFRGYLDRRLQLLERDAIYPPALYVPQRAEFESGSDKMVSDDALGELSRLLASPLGRFVVVLGDFGTGKTFLLHELARRMTLERGPLVPVLIEMRTLEKKAQLDALVAQHFMLAGMERFDRRTFRYMLDEGRIALLFDGFDELALRVTYDRAAEHFSTLIEAAQGQAKLVVTCRAQHFLSDQQVREKARQANGYRLARLQAFTEEQIQHFLVNQLGDEVAARRRYDLLGQVQDLRGLSHNPRMLGFISAISEQELLEAKGRDKQITASTLYEKILKRWLKNEEERAHPEGIEPGLDEEQRRHAATALAMLLWRRGERTINLEDIPETLKVEVEALANHKLDEGVFNHQVGSGTLLVRDDGKNFSFIHQSIMEWLVAKEAARELSSPGSSEALGVKIISPLMADFVWGLAGRHQAEQWAQDMLGKEATSTVHKNALLILKQLGVEAQSVKLAGQDLRGQDFSRKFLRGANLAGAILSGVSLIHADLTGATLTGTQLQRADLSKAVLEGADLSGADLSGARMLGAKMAGARLERTRFHGAKLIGAQFDPFALDGRGDDLKGAALPSNCPPAPMVSAASWCYSVAYSPNGRYLATGHDGSIRLWELGNGLEVRALKGHLGPVRSVAFSPDGTILASGSLDTTVRLWDVASGAERRILKGHSQHVWSVAFSPDGTTLASSSLDTTVRLWNVASGAERRVLKGHSDCVWSVAFSPDGMTLASGSHDSTVRLWDWCSDSEPRVLKGHSDSVRSVTFSPDGATLASGSHDSTVRLWDVASGSESCVLEGHSQRVWSVAFSPDGTTLASGSMDTTVRLWNVAAGSERRVLMGHSDSVWSVTFSPDGTALASGSHDSSVRLWDVASSSKRRVLTGHSQSVMSVALSVDGKTLASGSDDSTVRLWDMASGSERRVLLGHSQRVWSVAFSTDGKTLASGSLDSTVRLKLLTKVRFEGLETVSGMSRARGGRSGHRPGVHPAGAGAAAG